MGSVYSARYRFFLRRLGEARRAAGLTQVQVAEAFRTSQNHVSKCERGDRRVDVVELWEFAHLYGKPLDYFLDMESAGLGPAAVVKPRSGGTRRPPPGGVRRRTARR